MASEKRAATYVARHQVIARGETAQDHDKFKGP